MRGRWLSIKAELLSRLCCSAFFLTTRSPFWPYLRFRRRLPRKACLALFSPSVRRRSLAFYSRFKSDQWNLAPFSRFEGLCIGADRPAWSPWLRYCRESESPCCTRPAKHQVTTIPFRRHQSPAAAWLLADFQSRVPQHRPNEDRSFLIHGDDSSESCRESRTR